MARITLDLAHAYKANPHDDSDYALLPLKMEFADGDQVNYEIEVIDVSENQEVNHAC